MTPAPFDLSAATSHLRSRIGPVPAISIVLGSGLGAMEAELSDAVAVPFGEVPGYPEPGVQGHAGRYVAGRLGGSPVLLQCGRFHCYEGHSPEIVAAPVRVAAALGVRVVVFTNAAGAISSELEPGDVVLLDDHIDWMFRSPLTGPERPGEVRFPDMTEPYDAELSRVALEVARESGSKLEEGTYVAVLGPAYETPAEVRMLDRLGAHVVGMSTVPEVIVARANRLRCLGLSVVTNKAAGLGAGPLSHDEVIEVGRVAGLQLARLLTSLVPRIGEELYSVSAK